MIESGFHLSRSLFPHKHSKGGSDIIQVPAIIQAVQCLCAHIIHFSLH